MSGMSVKMRGHCFDSIEAISEAMKNTISGDLICENYRRVGLVNVGILSFEKYFFRNGSYASLTVVLTEDGEEKTADIIGSGGGNGLFNISWGANNEITMDAVNLLSKFGLTQQ